MPCFPVFRSIAAACAVLVCASAGASYDGPYDRFVNRSAPDLKLERYQGGTLGVVLPGWERMYLYAAWRAIALGADGLKTAPNPQGGLSASVGGQTGWLNTDDGSASYGNWEKAMAAAQKRAPKAPKEGELLASGYLNCPLSSYSFAAKTLNALGKRADATPARLNAWIASQRQVFKFCGDDADNPQPRYGEPQKVPAMPAELPTGETLYWRQMQQYQLGAAAFYNKDYAGSAKRFAQIGAEAGHPLRHWGAYLSLRSDARAAFASREAETNPAQEQSPAPLPAKSQARAAATPAAAASGPQVQLAALRASAERILGDPALADLHEATRAIVRSAQARLTPSARFTELSKLLDDPHADPYLEDHLGDWRVLANVLMSDFASESNRAMAKQLRANTGFIDWVQTMQDCERAATEKQRCVPERAHALALWRASAEHKDANARVQARLWLTASAAMADTLPADLEKAALQVPEKAPEYLTLRYALARHYRIEHQPAKTREICDAVLKSKLLSGAASISSRNLFLQERFGASTSVADAAGYLMRSPSRESDPDTGETAPAPDTREAAADGLRWLNALSVAELSALAGDTRFPPGLRSSIAVAAWMRAELLAQDKAALAAAQLVQRGTGALAEPMQRYQRYKTAAERRHWMLLVALRLGLTPVVNNVSEMDGAARADDAVTADLWCKIPSGYGSNGEPETGVERVPPMPTTGQDAARQREIAALAALKTATGYVGDHVMARAVKVPGDADLPWLLHVVVESTRGGCLDADSKVLSKKAFSLLHKRFGRSEWAAQTPYFY
ncbi:hypothetical protein HSX11_04480 [Oxalobacteraceae bacterium]|nr:hypothetical protein [Oxalobacteraceae bacterium]